MAASTPVLCRPSGLHVLLALLFFLAPEALRFHPYTAPLADVVAWLGDRVVQGITAVAFFFAIYAGTSIACDAWRWISGVSTDTPTTSPHPTPTPTVSPTELEEGTAIPAVAPEAQENSAAASAPAPAAPSPATPQATLCGKLLLLILSSAFFAWDLLSRHIVSSEKPLLNNTADTLLYMLRGWEVVFLMVAVSVSVSWARIKFAARATARAAAEPVEVLFEGTLPEEETNKLDAKEAEKV